MEQFKSEKLTAFFITKQSTKKKYNKHEQTKATKLQLLICLFVCSNLKMSSMICIHELFYNFTTKVAIITKYVKRVGQSYIMYL